MPTSSQILNKGRYQIINSFSQDATGALYEAVDTESNVPVIVSETVGRFGRVATTSQIEAFNAEFIGEARVLAEVEHESLVGVLDYFSEIDRQYIVFESLSGNALSRYLRAGVERPSLNVILEWADQLLDGLAFLHKQSPPIIHSQINPETIRLTSDLKIKLLTTKATPVTVSSYGFATDPVDRDPSFSYKPLEQLWPYLGEVSQRVILNSYDERAASELLKPLDARTDLYSAAASLYHVLTGRTPCDALERSIAILDGNPDPLKEPARIDDTIPVEISDAFMRALSLKRETRFDSAVLMRQVFRTAMIRSAERSTAATTGSSSTTATISPDIQLADDEREREILAEQARLDEEQKRLEQRRMELEAERERHAAERARLRLEAENEQRLARAELEKKAEEERQRVAQRLADLEAERAREKAEEERLELEAQNERRRADERLNELKLEQERHRAEQKRLELEAKLELERAEERIKELSASNPPTPELVPDPNEPIFEGDEISIGPFEPRDFDDLSVPHFQEQPGFNWRMPAIVGGVVIVAAGAFGVLQFMPEDRPSNPVQQSVKTEVPEEKAPLAVQSKFEPAAINEQPAISTDAPAEISPAQTSVVDETLGGSDKPRHPQTAAVQTKRSADKPAPAPAKKKVTVDDLINDN